jgi:hypothetical protein
MFSKIYHGIVGVITIETVPAEKDRPAARLEAEATLGQMLLYLAIDYHGYPVPQNARPTACCFECRESETRAGRFAAGSARLKARAAHVAADFDSLSHELDRALLETRRRIAAAV